MLVNRQNCFVYSYYIPKYGSNKTKMKRDDTFEKDELISKNKITIPI